MRSRYTAFVLEDADHLLGTWDPSTRPADLEFTPGLHWLRLLVVARTGGGPFDDTGTVEFDAVYRLDGRRGSQRENSTFVRTGGRWLYVGVLGGRGSAERDR